jgi:hypothetical protein
MKIEFVPYELALRMRNLGFNEPCFVWADVYTKENVYMYPTNENNMNQYNETVSIPLFQQAFRWFREKYNLEGIPQRAEEREWYKFWVYELHEDCKVMISSEIQFTTYAEAELACLGNLIEIVELKSEDERKK